MAHQQFQCSKNESIWVVFMTRNHFSHSVEGGNISHSAFHKTRKILNKIVNTRVNIIRTIVNSKVCRVLNFKSGYHIFRLNLPPTDDTKLSPTAVLTDSPSIAIARDCISDLRNINQSSMWISI